MKQCRQYACLSIASFVLSLVANSAVATVAVTDFDDGTFQGWTPWGEKYGEINLLPSGSNPGGAVRAVDTVAGGGGFGVSAPAEYLGDLSGWSALLWDEKPLLSSNLVTSTWAFLIGEDGTVYRNIVAKGTAGQWRQRQALLVSADWELSPYSTGTASLADVLSNVVELRIVMDINAGSLPTLEADVDNIVLVPEPGSMLFVALSLVVFLRRAE